MSLPTFQPCRRRQCLKTGFVVLSYVCNMMAYAVRTCKHITLNTVQKVTVSLCLINYALCSEHIRESGDIALPFLTSVLDGGEWPTSRPGRCTLWERAPGSHWIGGWVGARVLVLKK
jgi:hypothetical protein